MTYTTGDLYELLPAVYRIRDAEQGQVLKALISVLATQAQVVEEDITRLYENWFIETCEPWVVPYIGELLGVRGLNSVSGATFSLRARVANTLAYRRRKGTAAMLEQLARDTTDWPAHAVEFFELLGTTQNYNHLRLFNLITPDLRRTDLLELLNTPFDQIAHTVDVRHIASGRGKHNIPNIGLFLWRLQDYPLTGVSAKSVTSPPDGRFTFNPIGIDAPLFNSPQLEIEITHLAKEINVPAPLRRRPLYDELEARRQASTDLKVPNAAYFGTSPVFQVYPSAGATALQPEEILICDLSDWHHPASTKGYNKSPKAPYQTTDPNLPDQTFQIKAAVDPVLGRITFPSGVTPNAIHVDYAYGFSGDMGGGPYDRSDSIRALRSLDGEQAFLDKVQWRAGVSQVLPSGPSGPYTIFPTLAAAVTSWKQQVPGTVGTIAVLDSRTYSESLTGADKIEVPEGSQLMIFAADLGKNQLLGSEVPREQRAHVRGDISVAGTAPASSQTAGELILNGVLVEGNVKVLSGQLERLRVSHCTIVPGSGGLAVNGANDELVVRVERSICGPIDLPASVTQLFVIDSIVKGAVTTATVPPGTRAELTASTFFGTVDVKQLEGSNSIFMGKVSAQLRQAGCVRFCFVPDGSITPRRYRCQPDLALQGVDDPAAQQEILLRMEPAFTSIAYGQPGYAQLKLTVPLDIRAGADDGAEMGAFHFLQQPQREANLRASLDEYLRFSLEAGIFYAT
jgi:hypothetical protein